MARIKSVKMGNVAMMDFRGLKIPILQPFLQLPGVPNFIGANRPPGQGQLLAKFRGPRRGFRPDLIVFANKSRRICMSIVGPAQTS